MASNWRTCGVCDKRQITKPSIVWCYDCDEGLCKDCKEYHSISNGTKYHETVYIAEYKKLPSEILQNATSCKLHSEKYELFCCKHDCACCRKCLKSHSDCKGLTDINEFIKNVKTSNAACYEVEQNMLEIVENIKRIRTNRKENLTSLENKRREIQAEIQQTRTKVNSHLDKLQDELIEQLITVEEKERNKIQHVLTSLTTKEKEITEYQANVADIKQNASKIQTFLVMKHIEKNISAEEKFIQSLAKSDTTNHINISLQMNKSLQQFTSNVQMFGDITVSSDQCDLSIQKRKDKQAQIMVALPTKTIDKLTVTLLKHFNTELTNVIGCSVIPDGRMVLSCLQRKIRVFKTDGSKDFEIEKIGNTFDVVFIGDDSIAVTSGLSEKIYIIDLKKQQLRKTIKVNSGNDGIAYKDGCLIYCARNEGLQMLSINDSSMTNVTNKKLSVFAYVTTFGDKLFYTDTGTNSVTCCDYHGNTLWVFCKSSVLVAPYGISVDNVGNVFLAGVVSNNVVVISPDGQRYREILSNEDGLDKPQVLHYDQSRDTLLIANRGNNAWLYAIK